MWTTFRAPLSLDPLERDPLSFLSDDLELFLEPFELLVFELLELLGFLSEIFLDEGFEEPLFVGRTLASDSTADSVLLLTLSNLTSGLNKMYGITLG